jgi:hypothetical protein
VFQNGRESRNKRKKKEKEEVFTSSVIVGLAPKPFYSSQSCRGLTLSFYAYRFKANLLHSRFLN